MESSGKEKISVGKRAWMTWKKHPGELLRLGIFHFLPRALMAALVYACMEAGERASDFPAAWVALILGVLFLVFYLMPSRFYLCGKMRELAAGEAAPKEGYLLFLKAGLLRLGRGILWGLPFFAGLSLFLYGMEYLPYNELGKVLQKFVLFGEATVARGLIIVLLLLLLLLALFIYGWRRDMAWEYWPEERKKGAALACRKDKGTMMKNAAVNAFFLLPALLGCAAVLVPYAQSNMRVSSNLLRTVQSLLQLMKTLMPLSQMLWLLGVAAVLYMPFFLYRKMRTAVLVQALKEGQDAA